jgi:hypothetical protein
MAMVLKKITTQEALKKVSLCPERSESEKSRVIGE